MKVSKVTLACALCLFTGTLAYANTGTVTQSIEQQAFSPKGAADRVNQASSVYGRQMAEKGYQAPVYNIAGDWVQNYDIDNDNRGQSHYSSSITTIGTNINNDITGDNNNVDIDGSNVGDTSTDADVDLKSFLDDIIIAPLPMPKPVKAESNGG